MQDDKNSNNYSFSLLMANYNNANYIETAINSVLKQTYTNWELIIVDDCSVDDALKIIKPFLSDKRIKLIQLKQNLGYGGSLKTAADHASNAIIGIIDADDKLHEKALEIITDSYQKNPEYGFMYSSMWDCDSQLKNCVKNDWIRPDIPEKSNIFKIKISHFKTFRKSAYLKTSGFDPNQKKAVDKDIIFKLEEVAKFKFVDIPLYFYRWHGRGISQSKSAFEPELYHYLAKLKAYKRRLNINIPNLTKKQIYFEYYRIVFFKLTHFLISFYRKLKLSELLDKFHLKNFYVLKKFEEKFKIMKKLN